MNGCKNNFLDKKKENANQNKNPVTADGGTHVFALTPIFTTGDWNTTTNLPNLNFDPDVLDELSDYARSSSSEHTSYVESCPAVIEAQKAAVITAQKDTLFYNLNYSYDLNGECYKELRGKVTRKHYFFIQCQNGDLSSLNQKSVHDFYNLPDSETEELCPPNSLTNTYWESYWAMKGEGTYTREDPEGNPPLVVKIPFDSLYIMKSSNGDKPCKNQRINVNSTQIIDCTEKFLKTSLHYDEKTKNHIKRSSYKEEITKNIKENFNSSEYLGYSDGKITYKYNNWTGEINFGALTANPQYTLTNGTETKSGEIIAPQSLSLTSPNKSSMRSSKRVFNKFFK